MSHESLSRSWIEEQENLKKHLVLHDTFRWVLEESEIGGSTSNFHSLNAALKEKNTSQSNAKILRHIAGLDISFMKTTKDVNDNKKDFISQQNNFDKSNDLSSVGKDTNNSIPFVKCMEEVNEGDVIHREDQIACASLIVLSYPNLEVVYESYKKVLMKLPYIPGFLAFRETPVYMELLTELEKKAPQYKPDILMVDGNGILHPRGFGVASHIGVLANIPSIGIAKSLHCFDGLSNEEMKTTLNDLLEEHSKVSQAKGNKSQINSSNELSLPSSEDAISNGRNCEEPPCSLEYNSCIKNVLDLPNAVKSKLKSSVGIEVKGRSNGKVLGCALLPLPNVQKPIFVSIGHQISLETAVILTVVSSFYRVPEPVRQADLRSRKLIREWSSLEANL